MYTFLRMGVIDFKNRMKMYDYCIIIFNLIRPLRVGRKERSDGIARGHCASCASVNDDYIRQSQGLDLSTTIEVTRYGL